MRTFTASQDARTASASALCAPYMCDASVSEMRANWLNVAFGRLDLFLVHDEKMPEERRKWM